MFLRTFQTWKLGNSSKTPVIAQSYPGFEKVIESVHPRGVWAYPFSIKKTKGELEFPKTELWV